MDVVNAIHALAWHPREPVLAFGGNADRVFLYDFAAGELRQGDVGRQAVQHLAWHPQGEWLAVGDGSGALHQVAVDGRAIRSVWQDEGFDPRCDGVAVSPDGTRLAATGLNCGVRLYDVAGSQPRELRREPGIARSYCLAWSPDSQHLACGNWGAVVQIWTRDLQPVRTIQSAVPGEIRALVFDAAGEQILVGGGTGSDNAVACWNLQGRQVARAAIPNLVQGVARHPTTGEIAAAAWDNNIYLVSPDAQRLVRTLTGHGQRVWTVDYSPNGQWLASSGDDGQLRLWDATTYAEAGVVRAAADEVVLAYSGPPPALLADFDDATQEEKNRLHFEGAWPAATAGRATRAPAGQRRERLWQRFTSDARRAVLAARTEAQQANAAQIGAGHLLLGVLGLQEGRAREALESLRANPTALHAEVQRSLPRPAALGSGRSPSFAAEIRGVLAQAYEEARGLGDEHIGTEHLLLALLGGEAGPGVEALQRRGITADRVRAALRR